MSSFLSSYHFKILALVLTLSLIPLGVVGFYFISSEIDRNTLLLENDLRHTIEVGSNELADWIEDKKTTTYEIANEQIVITSVKKLIDSEIDSEKFEAKFELEKRFNSKLDSHTWITEIIVVDLKGNPILFTDIPDLKMTFLGESNFENALDGNISISKIHLSEKNLKNEFGIYDKEVPTFLIYTPIISDVGIEAVLISRISVFDIPILTPEIFDFHSTQGYLVDSDGYFISKPNFLTSEIDLNSIKRPEMKLRITDPVSGELTDIFELSQSNMSYELLLDYTDYLGENVIGAISKVEGTDWSYIIEINKNEAFLDLEKLRILLFSVIGVLLASVISISLYFTSNLIRPIKTLKEGAVKVGEGNLEWGLSSEGNDEISDLTNSFRNMVLSLKTSKESQREAENKYRNLYENSPALHRTIDLNGIILDCNQSYANRFGYTKKEIIGSSIFDHIANEDRDALQTSFETWKDTGYLASKELWFQTKTGEMFPALISASNLRDADGNLIGSNTILRDITDFYKSLEIEKERNQAIEDMEELKSINKIKDEFISVISHELGTPVLPIKGICEIMLDDDFKDKLTPEQKRLVALIYSNTDRLNSLINQLLLYQRLEVGKYVFVNENIDVRNFMDDVFTNYQSILSKNDIEFVNTTKDDLVVVGDKNALHEIFSNLINNAISFVPKENGKIEIGAAKENDKISFHVKDNGPGIPKDQQKLLFEKFFQLDSSHRREHQGLGLGLSICGKLVTGMKGEITVDSELGVGTTFTFNLNEGMS